MAGEIKYGIALYLRDQVSEALGAVQRQVSGFGDRIEATSRVAQRGLLGLVGGLGVVGYAFIEGESADNRLKQALATTGQYSDALYKHLQDLAAQTQQNTNVSDDLQKSLMAQAVQMGATADQLPAVMRNAIGLAEALGMDLPTALRASMAALSGNYSLLERQVPALREMSSEGEKAAAVAGIMERGFKQSQAQAGTFGGMVKGLKGDIGDLLEAMGGAVFGGRSWSETIGFVRDKVKELRDWLNGLTDAQRDHIASGVKVTAVTLGTLAVLGPLAMGFEAVLGILGFLNSAMITTSTVGQMSVTAFFKEAWVAVKAFLTVLGGASIVVGLIALIAGSLIVVSDALGITNIGLFEMLRRLDPLDWAWTSLAAGITRAAGKMEAAWQRAFGNPEGAARITSQTEETVTSIWADYHARRARYAAEDAKAQETAASAGADSVRTELDKLQGDLSNWKAGATDNLTAPFGAMGQAAADGAKAAVDEVAAAFQGAPVAPEKPREGAPELSKEQAEALMARGPAAYAAWKGGKPFEWTPDEQFQRDLQSGKPVDWSKYPQAPAAAESPVANLRPGQMETTVPVLDESGNVIAYQVTTTSAKQRAGSGREAVLASPEYKSAESAILGRQKLASMLGKAGREDAAEKVWHQAVRMREALDQYVAWMTERQEATGVELTRMKDMMRRAMMART